MVGEGQEKGGGQYQAEDSWRAGGWRGRQLAKRPLLAAPTRSSHPAWLLPGLLQLPQAYLWASGEDWSAWPAAARPAP